MRFEILQRQSKLIEKPLIILKEDFRRHSFYSLVFQIIFEDFISLLKKKVFEHQSQIHLYVAY